MFPKPFQIWYGALLGSIAHAFGVNRFPVLAHEQSWKNTNYSFQDSQGSRGTVAFQDKRFVAVFFLETSPRNPFANTDASLDVAKYFETIPRNLEVLARVETLQYVLQDKPIGAAPIITSAFWADGIHEYSAAAEPWEEVFAHGAVLIRKQLLPPEDALPLWCEEYEMDSTEANAVMSLYIKRVQNEEIVLGVDEETSQLIESRSKGQAGFNACCESLLEVGFVLDRSR